MKKRIKKIKSCLLRVRRLGRLIGIYVIGKRVAKEKTGMRRTNPCGVSIFLRAVVFKHLGTFRRRRFKRISLHLSLVKLHFYALFLPLKVFMVASLSVRAALWQAAHYQQYLQYSQCCQGKNGNEMTPFNYLADRFSISSKTS
jgi:hypothetical protein